MNKIFIRLAVFSLLITSIFAVNFLIPTTSVHAQSNCEMIETLISAGVVPPSKADAARFAAGCTTPVPPVVSTSTQPIVTIMSESIMLDYDDNRESKLDATVKFSIDNNSDDDVYFYKDWSRLNFYDQGGKTAYFNSQVNVTVSDLDLKQVEDNQGIAMWVIPAGDKVIFKVTSMVNPSQMFVGYYYASLSFLYANNSLDNSTSYNLVVPKNKTNSVVIIGETSPYITSVTDPISVGEKMIINGERLTGGMGDGHVTIFHSGGTNPMKVNSVDGSKDGKTLFFTLPNLNSNKGESWYYLVVNDPKTGESNRAGFSVTDDEPTPYITVYSSGITDWQQGLSYGVPVITSGVDAVYTRLSSVSGNRTVDSESREVNRDGKDNIVVDVPKDFPVGDAKLYVIAKGESGVTGTFPGYLKIISAAPSTIPPSVLLTGVYKGNSRPDKLNVKVGDTFQVKATVAGINSPYNISWLLPELKQFSCVDLKSLTITCTANTVTNDSKISAQVEKDKKVYNSYNQMPVIVTGSIVYATCGSANNGSFSSAPTKDLCGSGSSVSRASKLESDDKWWWSCKRNTNPAPEDTWCKADKKAADPKPDTTVIWPKCGPASEKLSASMPESGLCDIGTIGRSGSTSETPSRWYWSCIGQNNTWEDNAIWCFAPKSNSAQAEKTSFFGAVITSIADLFR